MNTITKTRTRFELKSLDKGARKFTGLASTWAEDLGGDVIHKGAFRASLREWKARGKIIPLIDQHNYGSIRSVVGKLINAKETDDGLVTEFSVIDGPDGDEVLRRIEGQYVDGLSIGYEASKWEHEETDDSRYGIIRHLKEVRLHEVSVVIWPMNEGARIEAAKSLIGTLTDEQRDELRAALVAPAAKGSEDAAPSGATDEGAPDTSALDRLMLARLGVNIN